MIRLTRAQVREIDRRAIDTYHIPSIVLMENAARGVVALAEKMLAGNAGSNVLIICGGGNNGGDGLAVARHLHNRNFSVTVLLATPPGDLHGDALVNYQIVEAMKMKVQIAMPDLILQHPSDLVIDALFGTGLTSPPRADSAALIQAINKQSNPILAIDVPSGLDCDKGEPMGSCVRAARTVTFVAEKIGFERPRAKHFLGDVTVAEIGCPRELIDQVLAEV
ncbi:MAG TPA: NAD(P)H-hydrate epimerase [Tepidisphaeraceae bacterium]|jgi:NAD(P)H-hydrate epimerase